MALIPDKNLDDILQNFSSKELKNLLEEKFSSSEDIRDAILGGLDPSLRASASASFQGVSSLIEFRSLLNYKYLEKANVRDRIREKLTLPSDLSSYDLGFGSKGLNLYPLRKTHSYRLDRGGVYDAENIEDFVKFDVGALSFDENDIPFILVEFLLDSSARQTLDTNTRFRSFTMNIIYYGNSYLESVPRSSGQGTEIIEKLYEDSDRKKIIKDLEEIAFLIESGIISQNLYTVSGITGFDLDRVEFSLDIPEFKSVIAAATLSYTINYSLSFPK